MGYAWDNRNLRFRLGYYAVFVGQHAYLPLAGPIPVDLFAAVIYKVSYGFFCPSQGERNHKNNSCSIQTRPNVASGSQLCHATRDLLIFSSSRIQGCDRFEVLTFWGLLDYNLSL